MNVAVGTIFSSRRVGHAASALRVTTSRQTSGGREPMKRKFGVFTGGACLLLASVGVAFAANPQTKGQPSKSCQVTTVTPGAAVSAPGSAFNPAGQAGSVYAGQQPQNSGNPNAVAQYDVACFQLSP